METLTSHESLAMLSSCYPRSLEMSLLSHPICAARLHIEGLWYRRSLRFGTTSCATDAFSDYWVDGASVLPLRPLDKEGKVQGYGLYADRGNIEPQPHIVEYGVACRMTNTNEGGCPGVCRYTRKETYSLSVR